MPSSITSEQQRVEPILADAFGTQVRIAAWERIVPWFVVRCALKGESSEVPASVIVKSLREHPEGFRTDSQQVVTECVALEFVADLGLDVVPRLLASDLDAGLLVLEDLAPRTALYDLIRHDAPGAEEGLASFARATGELGAGTVGRSDVYYERRSALGPIDPRAERLRFMGWGWSETRQYCEALDVPIRGEAEMEMSAVVEVLDDPGPFLALSNGDSGANNYLVDGGDGRIIDFEFAGYRHALTDAVCLYVPGSMWMTVGDPIARSREDLSRGSIPRDCRGVRRRVLRHRYRGGLYRIRRGTPAPVPEVGRAGARP